ncbi:MAG TPA: hypothetical protein DCZ73_06160, partial [Bacteroides sp.]|nr:hypothetical protein [Bacteroides sp.]
EMTAVMMESARKGYWEASEAQLKDIAELHTDLVRRFGQQSGFSGNNAKLQDFIASNVGMQQAAEYRQKVTEMKEAVLSENVDAKGMKLQKSSVASEMEKDTNTLSGTWVVLVVLVVFVALLVVLRKKRKGQEEK